MDQPVLAIIILCLIIVSFVTQIIPLPLTAVLGALAMMVAGILTPAQAVANFGNDIVMLVVGVSTIGNAVFETGLASKIGNAITSFKPAARNEKMFLFIVLLVVMVLSAFLNNTATVAIFMPLVATVARTTKGVITKKNCYMAIGIASVVGGNLTLAGSTPQLVAQGFLTSMEGTRPLGFFELAIGALPVAAIMLIYYMTLGYKLQQKAFDFDDVPDADSASGEAAHFDRLHAVIVGVVLAGCIVCFVTGVYSLGTVSLIGAAICIITGCISLDKTFQMMDWSTVAVMGGSLGFAAGLQASGAGELIATKLLYLFGGESANPFLLCTMFIVLASVLGNVMSHVASVSILIPIACPVALAIGANPMAFAVGIIIGCNLSFCTPVGTTPMTMTLVGGYRFTDYVKVGGLLNVLAVIATIILIPLLYGL